MAAAAAKLAAQEAVKAAAEANAAAAAEAAARAFVPRRHRHRDGAKAEEQEEKLRSAYADKLLIDFLLWTCRDEIQEADGDDSEAEARRHAESADAARSVCDHLREASIQLPAALRHWEHDVHAVDEAQLAAAPAGSDDELGTPISDVRIAAQRVKRFITALPRARRGGSRAASSHAGSLVDSMAGVLLLISMGPRVVSSGLRRPDAYERCPSPTSG